VTRALLCLLCLGCGATPPFLEGARAIPPAGDAPAVMVLDDLTWSPRERLRHRVIHVRSAKGAARARLEIRLGRGETVAFAAARAGRPGAWRPVDAALARALSQARSKRNTPHREPVSLEPGESLEWVLQVNTRDQTLRWHRPSGPLPILEARVRARQATGHVPVGGTVTEQDPVEWVARDVPPRRASVNGVAWDRSEPWVAARWGPPTRWEAIAAAWTRAPARAACDAECVGELWGDRKRSRHISGALGLFGGRRPAGAELLLAGQRGLPEPQPSLPSPGWTTRALVRLPAAPWWLDPGCEICAPGEISARSWGQRAIVVGGGAVQLEAVPTPVRRERIQGRFALDGGRQLSGTLTLSAEGEQAARLQHNAKAWGPKEWTREARTRLRALWPRWILTESKPGVCEAASCTQSLSLRRRNFARTSAGALRFQLGFLARRGRLPDVEKDVWEIPQRRELHEDVRVALPAGFALSWGPAPVTHTEPEVGEATLAVTLEGGDLVVRRSLTMQPGRYAGPRMETLRALLVAHRDMRRARVLCHRPESGWAAR
jgi:hypothetical protein